MFTSARLGESPFAIVDLETTGLYFNKDRILEVAIIRLRPDGTVEDEYETLVNPRRDVGASEIHRITASDVAQAPVFADVAVDIGKRLQDAVIVGHNLRFDLAFLGSEYARLDVRMPELPRLCTLRLARALLPVPARSLGDCCAELGIKHEGVHSALGDAQATAQLLKALIETAHQEGVCSLGELGCEPLAIPRPWISGHPSGKRCTRSDATRFATEARGYLARLVSRLPGDEATNADEAEYLAVLDRALEDRRVTPAEGQALMEVARLLKLSRADVERAHDTYVRGLVSAAWSDGSITEVELQDLLLVGEMLGVPPDRVVNFVNQRPADVPAQVRGKDLRGKRVCFTGSLQEYTYNGSPLTREFVSALATAGGLVVSPSVTKKLDILVVADANTLSTKARKAQEYGTRIMAATAFFSALGVNIER